MELGERVLIAEDDEVTRTVLMRVLSRAGYRILETNNGRESLRLALEENPGLIVIDIEMPELGGLEVIAELRSRGWANAILVLSARAEVDDKVTGLTAGADDYLVKPYSPEELLARVRALLRKHERKAVVEGPITIGRAVIDSGACVARIDGREVRLTRTECAIIKLLAEHRGRPAARELLLDRVWGYTYLPETRTLDTHIWRLRRKLGDTDETNRWIVNVPGVGYQLQPDATNAAATAPEEPTRDGPALSPQ